MRRPGPRPATVYVVDTTAGPRYFFTVAAASKFIVADQKAGNPVTTRRTTWTATDAAALLEAKDTEIARLKEDVRYLEGKARGDDR